MTVRKRVVILGGGIAGLSAAWELSRPEAQASVESVTVYQRGWRLGGKGASSRGVHGRIEEHGLHVWLGYYENAFRLVRECYAELDRATSRPACAIRDWDDAFHPASRVGLGEVRDGHWLSWFADFPETDELPGETDAGQDPASPAAFARRAMSLILKFVGSVGESAEPSPRFVLSAGREPPPRQALLADVLGWTEVAAIAAALVGLAVGSSALALLREQESAFAPLLASVDAAGRRIREALARRADDDIRTRRAWLFLDLLVATVRGALVDQLFTRPEGFSAIDHYEYREWIARHGASAEALDSPFVRGLYDLVFAYENGDPERPRFAAGTGLLDSLKFFFDYRGSIFWKMTAGMGDVVFAPLYEVLVARGVEFRFFHRVDNLRVSDNGDAIEAIDFGVQTRLRADCERYEPLVDVDGLPCWPARPRDELLENTEASSPDDFESLWSTWADVDRCCIRAGRDFDVAVLAIPVGMHPYICRELIENPRTPTWRSMTERLGTTPTQAMQLWLRVDERSLGWRGPGGTITGNPGAFHTYASMSHLILAERWPARDQPATLAYFCHTLAADSPPPASDADYPARELARVRVAAANFLRSDVRHLWPDAVADGDFRWGLLCSGEAEGEARLDDQYLRANVDPSDRYVLSLPGTDRYRLRANESGYHNLVLAGDWIDSGLNAGCIEAAVMAGIQAANAALGRPLLQRVAGFYLSHQGYADRSWT